MTREQQVALLHRYAEKFKNWSRERCPADYDNVPGMGRAVKHANWMIHELLAKIERNEVREGQVDRWIGFIQGVFWSNGLFSIDNMREHNVSPVGESS